MIIDRKRFNDWITVLRYGNGFISTKLCPPPLVLYKLFRFSSHLVCLLPREVTGHFEGSTVSGGRVSMSWALFHFFVGILLVLDPSGFIPCLNWCTVLGPLESPSYHSINYVVVLGSHSQSTRSNSDFPVCCGCPVVDPFPGCSLGHLGGDAGSWLGPCPAACPLSPHRLVLFLLKPQHQCSDAERNSEKGFWCEEKE